MNTGSISVGVNELGNTGLGHRFVSFSAFGEADELHGQPFGGASPGARHAAFSDRISGDLPIFWRGALHRDARQSGAIGAFGVRNGDAVANQWLQHKWLQVCRRLAAIAWQGHHDLVKAFAHVCQHRSFQPPTLERITFNLIQIEGDPRQEPPVNVAWWGGFGRSRQKQTPPPTRSKQTLNARA
jgi:hypothetical protein